MKLVFDAREHHPTVDLSRSRAAPDREIDELAGRAEREPLAAPRIGNHDPARRLGDPLEATHVDVIAQACGLPGGSDVRRA